MTGIEQGQEHDITGGKIMNKKDEMKFRNNMNDLAKKYNQNILYGFLDENEKKNKKFIAGASYPKQKLNLSLILNIFEVSGRLHQHIRECTRRFILNN